MVERRERQREEGVEENVRDVYNQVWEILMRRDVSGVGWVPGRSMCTCNLISYSQTLTPPHSLGTKDDPNTAGASASPSPSSSISSSPPPTSPPSKEKLTSGEEGVQEGRKQGEVERMKEERRSVGEEKRRSQEPKPKGGFRAITSDEEFERELTRAGKTLLVVDFTSGR